MSNAPVTNSGMVSASSKVSEEEKLAVLSKQPLGEQNKEKRNGDSDSDDEDDDKEVHVQDKKWKTLGDRFNEIDWNGYAFAAGEAVMSLFRKNRTKLLLERYTDHEGALECAFEDLQITWPEKKYLCELWLQIDEVGQPFSSAAMFCILVFVYVRT